MKKTLIVSIFSLLLAFSLKVLAEPVDINSADAATLAANIKGIGEKRAQAIVRYREQYGPFKAVEELANIKGIGPKLIENNRDKLLLTRSPATVD